MSNEENPLNTPGNANGKGEEKKPYLERVGMNYFRKMSSRRPPVDPDDEVHILNPEERAELKRISRGTIFRAGMAGALAAFIAGLIAIVAYPLLGDDINNPDFWESLRYWVVVSLGGLVLTFFEISFLYFDALRSVHKLSYAAGLDIFPEGDDGLAVANSLVRAALELPNPPDEEDSLNPRREVSKLRMLVGTIVYKLKVTVSNLIFKAVLRRLFARSGVAAWMEFTSIPVYAIWNAVLSSWVIREARIRCMGPSVAAEFCNQILKGDEDITKEGKLAVFRAIGSSVVRTVDLHPNVLAFYDEMAKRLGEPEDTVVIDDSKLFLEMIKKLSFKEQKLALQSLYISAVLDGRLVRREKRFIMNTLETLGQPRSLKTVRTLKKAFMRGDAIPDHIVESILPGQ